MINEEHGKASLFEQVEIPNESLKLLAISPLVW